MALATGVTGFIKAAMHGARRRPTCEPPVYHTAVSFIVRLGDQGEGVNSDTNVGAPCQQIRSSSTVNLDCGQPRWTAKQRVAELKSAVLKEPWFDALITFWAGPV